jgi:hypothetical protein
MLFQTMLLPLLGTGFTGLLEIVVVGSEGLVLTAEDLGLLAGVVLVGELKRKHPT